MDPKDNWVGQFYPSTGDLGHIRSPVDCSPCTPYVNNLHSQKAIQRYDDHKAPPFDFESATFPPTQASAAPRETLFQDESVDIAHEAQCSKQAAPNRSLLRENQPSVTEQLLKQDTDNGACFPQSFQNKLHRRSQLNPLEQQLHRFAIQHEQQSNPDLQVAQLSASHAGITMANWECPPQPQFPTPGRQHDHLIDARIYLENVGGLARDTSCNDVLIEGSNIGHGLAAPLQLATANSELQDEPAVYTLLPLRQMRLSNVDSFASNSDSLPRPHGPPQSPSVSPRTIIIRPRRPSGEPRKPRSSTRPNPLRKWSPARLRRLCKETRPRNLPEDVDYNELEAIDDIPLQKLVRDWTIIKGRNGFIGKMEDEAAREDMVDMCVGSRETGRRRSSQAPSVMNFQPMQESEAGQDEHSVQGATPFKLLIVNDEGQVMWDMQWQWKAEEAATNESPCSNPA